MFPCLPWFPSFLLLYLSCAGFCQLPFRLRFFLLISIFVSSRCIYCQASAFPRVMFFPAANSSPSFLHFSLALSFSRLVVLERSQNESKKRQNSRQACCRHVFFQHQQSTSTTTRTTMTSASATCQSTPLYLCMGTGYGLFMKYFTYV